MATELLFSIQKDFDFWVQRQLEKLPKMDVGETC